MLKEIEVHRELRVNKVHKELRVQVRQALKELKALKDLLVV